MKILRCPKCGNRPRLIFDNGWHGTKSYNCCGLKASFGSEYRYYRIKEWNAVVSDFLQKHNKE